MKTLPWLGLFLSLLSPLTSTAEDQPNVILILTDDQGIGDLGAHGNPWIQTPHLDTFYEDVVRLTDFHVSPVCTPTRGAIMTGRYPINNGAWATYKGRDALFGDSLTMAEVFQQNGYRTGLFGKWHLGDNYPVRPTDSGFDVAIHHKSGGVGELSDYWGNDYFDDVYFVNNTPQRFEGYCTDVWFEQAMKFIGETKDQPFFAYIPTNAPHGPHFVEEKYAAPYRHLVGEKIIGAEFYGMITNIDENFGKLEVFLQETGLADNTILIYMTDNGSGGGRANNSDLGHNHGFSGKKGSQLEGGHRVPFFIRWKDGNITGGRDLKDLSAHVDLLPTLAGLCGLDIPEQITLDGIDLSKRLQGGGSPERDRPVFVHNNQDWRPPQDENQTCIALGRWRLVNGTDLYDIEADRAQQNNIAQQHPDIVQQLLAQNLGFVTNAKTLREYQEFPPSVIGGPHQPRTTLTIQHAIGDDAGFWKCQHVAAGLKSENNRHAIEVERAGKYRISFRRWPIECPGPIHGIPAENPEDMFDYQTISPEIARLQIANQLIEKSIGPEDEAIDFDIWLGAGKTLLTNDFIEGNETYGVYYTYITPL
ncbi:MAG: arylsulfatase [Opitutaceae bacterium]|nr:arylsulfatase [Opitutaceae bacterium]